MTGTTQRTGRVALIGLIATTVIAASVGVTIMALGQSQPALLIADTNVGDPTFAIGPIHGLTSSWYSAPPVTSIPLGTYVQLHQPASPQSIVNWTGAEEVARDAQGSTAECWLLEPGPHVVRVDVLGSAQGQGSTGHVAELSSSCVLNVIDIPLDHITVSVGDVWVDPVAIDESLPPEQLNEQTMSYFFPISNSIAQLTTIGPNHYATSVNRQITFSAQTQPAGFEPLMEWRRDGEVLGLGQTLADHVLDAPGNYRLAVGPTAQPVEVQIDTYSVTITSHTSFLDIIPEGTPIVFEAVTDPGGYEDDITWLSSTKYGTGSPVLGSGPSFTVQFDATWGEQPDGSFFQWLGVRAGNAAFVQDQNTGACCLFEQNDCIEVPEDDCNALGGVFQGPGSRCADANCVLGACCLLPTLDDCGREIAPDPSCIDATTRSACAALGGVFLPRTPCEQQILIPIHTATEFSHRIETINNCPEPEDNPNDPCDEAGQGPCTECTVFVDPWGTRMTQGAPDDNAFNFAFTPIPPDFFFPGSGPFGDLVPVKPDPDLGLNPLDQDDVNAIVPGACPGVFSFGDADTLVLRTEDPFTRCEIPPFFPSDPVTVDIEVIALNLVGCDPITVTGPGPNQWILSVSVNTDHPFNSGSLTAIKEHCNGGTFTSELSVCPVFTFVEVGNPGNVRVIDLCENVGLAIDLTLDAQGWVHDQGANVCLRNPVCTDFHPGVDQTPPDFDCTDCQPNGIRDDCDIDPTDPDGNGNVSPDCNGNEVPDECDVPQSVGCPIGTCITNCSEDCNENCVPDECEPDTDNDGFIDDCDCDPLDPNVNPGEEESAAQGNCNDGLDNDCDGNTDAADPDCP